MKNLKLIKKWILNLMLVSFSVNLFASDLGATIIIEDMSYETEIGASTNSKASIVELQVVNLCNPGQLNETLNAVFCNTNITNCTYSITNDNFVNGNIYIVTIVMSDNSIKQKRFLFTKYN